MFPYRTDSISLIFALQPTLLAIGWRSCILCPKIGSLFGTARGSIMRSMTGHIQGTSGHLGSNPYDVRSDSHLMPKYHQMRIFLLLVVLMASWYMLSYRARIESGDTMRAMDAVTSQSRFGDWLMDETMWFKPPRRIRAGFDLPLNRYDVQEKLNLQLALPLLKLAENLPRLGNIHTLWLFNIIVTSLNAGLIYLIVRAFDYGDWTALCVAISAGLATNLWAYSQTFFREPLTSFFILTALFLIQTGRRHGFLRYAVGVFIGLAALFLAYSTKFSAVMAIPAVLIFALPTFKRFDKPAVRRASLLLLAVQALLLFGLMMIDPLPAALQNLFTAFNDTTAFIGYALRVYILSPGGSLWGTSPILFMSAVGCLILLRQGQHRLVWAVWLIFAGYSLGHALTTGGHWFGGHSWPPRFLVPIIPVVMLAAAPVARAIIHQRRKLPALLWVILLVYGIWIQFSSVSLSWHHYGETLPPESSRLSEWEPGLTQPQYFRWVTLPQRWSDLGLDFVWLRSALPSWGISFAAFGIGLAALLAASVRRPQTRLRYVSPLFALMWIPLLLFNLAAIYDKDPLTQAQKPALHEAMDFLSEHSQAGDILLLPNNVYANFILNHLDSSIPRPIILPASLAEAPSDKQPAQIESSNPNDWLHLSSIRAIHHIANRHDRFWYLANTSPFMTWSFRPVERYLALYYYPLREIRLAHTDDTVRLLEYSTRSAAPHPFSPFAADMPSDLKYGENIRLLGFQLPRGLQYEPGQILELSLLWQSDKELQVDYTVAWFAVDADTAQPIVQGQDSAPQAGFAPTSSWQANVPVWDNRALRLPPAAAAGEYLIWVLLYRYHPEIDAIEGLNVSGATVTENATIGVLPVRLVIG